MCRLYLLSFILLFPNFISAQEGYHPMVDFLPEKDVIEALAYDLENPNYEYSTNDKGIIKKLKEIEGKRGEYIKELHESNQLMY